MVMHNFTKLCRQFVALSCVEQRGADPCVQQAIDDINGFHKSQPAGSNTVVVMVVPAIIGALMYYTLRMVLDCATSILSYMTV